MSIGSSHAPTDRGQVLDGLQKQVLERAVPVLDRTLGAVDDYLFDRSQSGEEDLGLIALREMRRARSQIVKCFQQAVVQRFREIRMQIGMPVEESAEFSLSLLSDQDLEEQLAVEQLATSLLRRHAAAFEHVVKRMEVLTGIEGGSNDNPVGPAFLASALGGALDQLELDAALKIVVFKFFERELADDIGEIFQRANALMAAAGILPELQVVAARPKAPKTRRPAEMPAAAQEEDAADAVPQRERAPMQVNPADQAMFANMLGMLQGWRANTGMAMPQAGGQAQAPAGPTLDSGELLSILSLMQRDAPPPLAPPSQGGMSLAQQLREQMAHSARKLGVADDNMQLDGLDGDAVDLVALLFDVLLDGPQYDSRIRQMIGRMLVPYVKVAVKDRRMFLFKEHPARRLLNTVAEACEGNHGEAPQERALLTRVDHTIDRLVAEFNEDVAIFEALEQELRAYMAQHRKRFELAEKRTAEAQRGRERLDHARSLVAADLSSSLAGRQLPPVIDDFLNRHAAHHLAQVVLRDGHQAPRYNDAMRAVEDLLVAFDWASEGEAATALKPLPERELQEIFASSGCSGDAAQSAIDALHDALARIAEGESAVENDVRMPEQVVVPEPAPQPEPALELVAGKDSLDYDGAMLERMRALQVGNWLQLTAADGRVEPAKVSWISPISSRLLLVNRRGIRVLVASVEELAAMAKLGKVSLREADSAFEDAMHQVAGRLKSAAGPT